MIQANYGGIGELTAGSYVVPQNPLKMATEGVKYIPRVGDLVSANYVVPQNPLRDKLAGSVKPIGTSSGCGCAGKCGGQLNGIGTISTDFTQAQTDFTAGNYSTVLSDTIAGIPIWGILAAVGALAMFGGGGRRR